MVRKIPALLEFMESKTAQEAIFIKAVGLYYNALVREGCFNKGNRTVGYTTVYVFI